MFHLPKRINFVTLQQNTNKWQLISLDPGSVSGIHIDPFTVHLPFFAVIILKQGMWSKSPTDTASSFHWSFLKLQMSAVFENNNSNLKVLVTCFGKWKVLLKSHILGICHSVEPPKNPLK